MKVLGSLSFVQKFFKVLALFLAFGGFFGAWYSIGWSLSAGLLFLLSLLGTVFFLFDFRFSKTKSASLDEEQRILETVESASSVGYWKLDVKTDKMEWSNGLYQIYQLPKGKRVSLNQFLANFSSAGDSSIASMIEDCLASEVAREKEFEFTDNEGTKKWVRVFAEPIEKKAGQVVRLGGVIQDVSRLKSLQEEQRFILASARVGIWKWDVKKNILRWDDSMYELFEVRREDFTGAYEAWESALEPTGKEQAIKELQEALQGEKDFDTTFAIKTPGGRTKYIGARGQCERDEKGEPYLMYGINWDRTESYRAEEELNRQRVFLKSTVDTIPSPFYIKTCEGEYIMVNEAFRQLLGMSDGEILGKTDFDIFPSEVAEKFRHNDKEVREQQRLIETEEVAVGQEQKNRIYHSFKFPFKTDKGDIYATGGLSLEITEKRELEQQAFHSSKLASIGALAAGVGHEINNPLAIIRGFANAATRKLKAGGDQLQMVFDDIEKIDLAVERIAKIVNGLRTFSRLDQGETEVFDLAEELSESLGLIEEIYATEGVVLTCNALSGLGPLQVMGDRGKIQQVFFNLITNARDATESQSSRKIEIHLNREEKNAVLTVADNGPGIPEDLRERIFDPFFTTKETRKGTGLGLSLVHGIIENHGGKIHMDTEVGNGTVMTVTLPLVD